ncbi:folylpolyglutamate synthase/dihydrofolate synthase family protein [Microbacterium sp. MPKO10]|uniref:bifunctional folylpolyglutamate synthase/dihydrofolate synthase n=1 Tax=Microbacterium sp. MPKO10 TaxID=2989818 RepID=UPI002235F684|nr:folylpolyglutamate synthase/dihydrofolate synthase family protein [Microbacterium sp. MPKO10]MCW4459694.1 bifunctional folylpolyglutamate synthase/dihydrofolate synthase [Microbacterium sp. MPKO10]
MSEPIVGSAGFAAEAADVIAELFARTGEGRPRPRLDPTRKIVELLGDPQRACPVIHLTGTNGKSSTSRFIDSILRAHGLRTGVFTSPHLRVFNERIMIDGAPISDEKLVENWYDIKPYVEMVDAELLEAGEVRLTFFETLTALAYASFAEAPVDVAIIEVGMGGEWDSTNVADASVAVFTPIDVDHTATLGGTITEIAATKAGIIKAGSRVVSAHQTSAALAEIERAAQHLGVPVIVEDRAFMLSNDVVAVGGQQISVRGQAGAYDDIFLPAFGDHQGHNAAVAIAVCETFLGDGTVPLNPEVLAQGLGAATSPGRLEIAATQPTILVDAAHNPHGARSLAEAVGRYFDSEHIGLVIGVLDDKDARGILQPLLPLAERVFTTQVDAERARDAEELAAEVQRVDPAQPVDAYDSVDEALTLAREWASAEPGRMLVVAGSVILAGEALLVVDDRGWA